MLYCEYGCGQEANFQLKNGKWCCSKSYNSCKISRITRSGWKHKKEIIEKFKEDRSGIKNPNYGKKCSEEKRKKLIDINKNISIDIRNKISKANKLSIEKIKKKYSLFSQIEEMRYNSDKPGEYEIQVHCKNHLCPNSKERDGWFTPSYIQLYERIRHLEKDYGNDGSYFYCCQECKNICPLYNLQGDPYKIKEKQEDKLYTDEEYQQFRDFVLKRDDYKCQYCEQQAVHVHHERPKKLEPFFSLDPDYAISVCKECHYKYGHKDECSTGQLANKICL